MKCPGGKNTELYFYMLYSADSYMLSIVEMVLRGRNPLNLTGKKWIQLKGG